MAWTEDRVKILAKLWADGLSASQIAAELGGVTRNAVIGKVHRLGLAGRAKSKSPSTRARLPRKRQPSTPRYRANYGTVGATALKQEVVYETEPDTGTEEIVIPVAQRRSILTINEKTCKWPIGDPGDDDFYFCGGDAGEDNAYCKFHARLAFQPPHHRRRAKAPRR